jgi:tannase/feruloyl esterase
MNVAGSNIASLRRAAPSSRPASLAVIAAVMISASMWNAPLMHAATCESLASLKLPNTAIDMAQSVAAGQLKLEVRGGGEEGGATNPTPFKDLPAFCRVAATLKPSADSDIKMEVWLPASGWNGKLKAEGNGGWAGSISYAAMAEALKRGYATTSTDTGHTGGRGTFVLGHPEKLKDYAGRAIHEMTVKAKAVTDAFYSNAPKFTYYQGCSTGGRQGLTEAQRFPDDFDGILVGSAANPRSTLALWQTWVGVVALKDAASRIPTSKLPMIHAAALEACDAKDGLKDGLIDDPRTCDFNPKVLLCKNGDGPTCLTAAQVETATRLLSPIKDTRTGAVLTPGLLPGSELNWAPNITGAEPRSSATDHFKYVVFEDPNWDWRTLDPDTAAPKAAETEQGINATDPNIKAFLARGRMIQTQGWADQNIPPQFSINYYNKVIETVGSATKVQDSYRLFMAPGMGVCGGGDGPNTFDALGAMEQWVEHKKAPDQIIASHSTDGKADRTRPLCPYPQVAKYKGSGSIDDAANFACRMP